jgi:hypothetical protein
MAAGAAAASASPNQSGTHNADTAGPAWSSGPTRACWYSRCPDGYWEAADFEAKFTPRRAASVAGLELALAARAALDAAILVLGHLEAAVHPALAEVEDEAPAQ